MKMYFIELDVYKAAIALRLIHLLLLWSTPIVKYPSHREIKLRKNLTEWNNWAIYVKQIEWVSPLVEVQKPNGKVRVCLNPRDLNKAIQREHYLMTTVQEIVAELREAKVFSVLDATSGFWHNQLDESITQLLTFNTPFGRYQYQRMSFGINSAHEIFQNRMTQAFVDLKGVKAIADDNLVWGENEIEHNRRLVQGQERWD